MRENFKDKSSRSILKPIDKSIKINNLQRKKRIKKSKDFFAGYRGQSINSYHLQSPYRSIKSDSGELLSFKLNDLLSKNKTLLKNLYAQINSNSNNINLFYIPSVPKNSGISNQIIYNDIYGRLNLVPLSGLVNNYSLNTNAVFNSFYLNAINLENNLNRQSKIYF